MLQSGLFSVMASVERDDGYGRNMLKNLMGQLTVVIRELTTEIVDPKSIMYGYGRYKMVRTMRGALLVLRYRRKPRVPRPLPFLATAPLKEPNTVVSGTVGKFHKLTPDERAKLKLWMYGNIPTYRNIQDKYKDYVEYCERENAKIRRRFGVKVGSSLLIDVPRMNDDPTDWLGRPYSKGEADLVQGAPFDCQSFGSVVIRGVSYRTVTQDFGKKTCQCFFRTFFQGVNKHGEDIETDRYAMIEAIHRVEFGGTPYVLVKGKWFPEFREEDIKKFAKINSMYGPDNIAKVVYTYDPCNPSTPWDTVDPFILAAQIEHQVVIKKHPCMKTAVILDLKADFFECIVDEDGTMSRPAGRMRRL
ncbi:hypothetical protein CYMTET_28671 [Cymbomonas tetramitiformis]|uniref:Uncharacterized protein n=1 Tax=Cymbomonas tetramitiformis TaxID=36881 RepID=A0AAE0FMC8_9CHLO|nr:hypothetical protein CYMTET_28671 [Cymbomonas tetramitiformis]